MSPRRKSKDSAEPRDTAKKLIELAADESTTTQERMSTAVKAVAIIRKYDLLSNPLDELSENETVKAARTIFSAFNDPAVKAAGNKIMDGIKGMRRR